MTPRASIAGTPNFRQPDWPARSGPEDPYFEPAIGIRKKVIRKKNSCQKLPSEGYLMVARDLGVFRKTRSTPALPESGPIFLFSLFASTADAVQRPCRPFLRHRCPFILSPIGRRLVHSASLSSTERAITRPRDLSGRFGHRHSSGHRMPPTAHAAHRLTRTIRLPVIRTPQYHLRGQFGNPRRARAHNISISELLSPRVKPDPACDCRQIHGNRRRSPLASENPD